MRTFLGLALWLLLQKVSFADPAPVLLGEKRAPICINLGACSLLFLISPDAVTLHDVFMGNDSLQGALCILTQLIPKG